MNAHEKLKFGSSLSRRDQPHQRHIRHAGLLSTGVGRISMIEAASANGWIDGERLMMESLTAFKRADCGGALTYFAPKLAEMLKAGGCPQR
jgi:Delta-aminolevulinic acid dehydratase